MKSFRIVLLALLTCAVPGRGAAPSPADPAADRAAVLKIVQEFFDALHTKDGARLRATCHPGAQITSLRPTAEGFTVRQRTIETDAAQIAESKDTWLERMWNPTVHVDGRIAVVWTRYDFHRNGALSHNGTDCFTFLRTEQGWKIVNAAYSVELGGPMQHPAGPPK